MSGNSEHVILRRRLSARFRGVAVQRLYLHQRAGAWAVLWDVTAFKGKEGRGDRQPADPADAHVHVHCRGPERRRGEGRGEEPHPAAARVLSESVSPFLKRGATADLKGRASQQRQEVRVGAGHVRPTQHRGVPPPRSAATSADGSSTSPGRGVAPLRSTWACRLPDPPPPTTEGCGEGVVEKKLQPG